MNKIVAVDFFCGAGGLTRGLINSGVDVRLGIEIDGQCKDTYEKNNPGTKMLVKDVRKVTPEEIKKGLGEFNREDLLLAACAPCQPFSQQRRDKQSYSEKNLVLEFGRFVASLKPKYVFIENVPGMKKVKGASSFRRFLKILERNGYAWKDEIINVKAYGVPQSRKRLVVFAGRGFIPIVPPATHGTTKGLDRYATVRDALKGLPRLKAGATHAEIDNHWAGSLNPVNLRRMKATPKNGGGRDSWPARLRLACHTKTVKGVSYAGHSDVYGRMWWNRPAPTLTCKCTSISNGRYGHPSQNRAISLREAARLQSFPDDYIFLGISKWHLAQQVGNAVPVKLGEVVGDYFMKKAPSILATF